MRHPDDPARFPIENPNPVFRVAANGSILFANRASDALLAWWGTSAAGRVPAEWQRRITDALASGAGQRVTEPYAGRTLELDIVPILARHYVNVYGRDVTEQEEARRAREALLVELAQEKARLAALAAELEQERDLQQTLMENSRASLVYLDRDFNLVRMNAAYEIACQRPRSTMLGRNHFALFPNAENEVFFRQVRDTGEAIAFLARPFEFADQPWRGVTYWDWTLTPIKRYGDEVEGLVLSMVDVTERVRAEKLTSALNDIHAAISSPLALAEIMQRLLEESVTALRSDSGGIALREGDCWVLRYGVGLPDSAFGLAMTDDEAPVSARVARERKPVAILDAGQEAEVNLRLMVRFGLHAVLALPLIVRDQVIGVLSFNYHRPRQALSQAETDFAGKLSVSASLALENARLLESESEQRQAAERRAAELEVTLEAISDGVIIYDRAGRVVRQNSASLRLLGYRAASGPLSAAEQIASLGAVLVDEPDTPAGQQLLVRALNGETVRSRLVRFVPGDSPGGPARYVLVSAASIRNASGSSVGLVASLTDVTELRHARDELEQRVQERTAELEASAAKLNASREQLRNLSQRLVELQESERSYVANELYNDEGQRLAALLLELGFLEKEARGHAGLEDGIARSRQLADGILADIHSLAVNLRPASLDRLGLVVALQHFAGELGRQYGLTIEVECTGLQAVALPARVEGLVYRIAQEALYNAVRHAEASQVSIVATRREGRLIVIIEDSGKGFDVEEAIRCGGLGLVGMNERAAMLGGNVTVESAPGKGTTVYIEVPLGAG